MQQIADPPSFAASSLGDIESQLLAEHHWSCSEMQFLVIAVARSLYFCIWATRVLI